MATITFKDISHSYVSSPGPDDYVLRHLDLEFADGGAYALLGPSGCGKTTMLNIISGLITPQSGQICYGDEDITALPTRRRNIAQVFQFPVIYDTMTIYDNLAFPLRNRGVAPRDVDQRVKAIAAILEIDRDRDLRKRAAGLTSDLQQIISLGRGLVRDDVAAILLDEPLTVIDPQRKWNLRRKLRQVHEEFRHTSIYVTHDQTEALTFADQVLVMNQGEIVQRGTPRELFERPAHTFVGYFIGTPGMNILPCELADRAALVAGHRVALADAVWHEASQKKGSFALGIRPEHAVLHGSDGDGRIPVDITAVEDHGHFRVVTVKLGPHTVRVELRGGDPARPGEKAHVELSGPFLHLYRDDRIVAAPPGTEQPS